jgi:hypothetical protein
MTSVLLTRYLFQIPVFLIWMAGIFVALLRWKKHPMASLLTAIALGLFLARGLAGPYLFIWLPMQLADGGDAARLGFFSGMLDAIWSLSGVIPWGLLLFALFWWQIRESTGKREAPNVFEHTAPD